MSPATRPSACMIVIGNEILSGRTQDTNINTLAKGLTEIGIDLREARVIPDLEATIAAVVNEARKAHDYVFTSGGIGPTHDDITSASVARAFGVPCVLNEDAKAALCRHYGKEITDARLRMAWLPENVELIPNPVSSAPGFRKGNVYVMAGVPGIFHAMFDQVKATLKGGPRLQSVTLSALIPESRLADAMTRLQRQHPEVEIGSYPQIRNGKVGTSVVLRGTDGTRLAELKAQLYEEMSKFTEAVVEGEL